MKTSRLLIGLLTLLLLLQPSSAENSLARVTQDTGQATSEGKQLKLLSKVFEGDSAQIAANSEYVFSYVSGGLRAKVVGPCQVKFTKSGPVLVTGKESQITVTRPKQRVGVALPTTANLLEGGHVRRGEFSIHLSRKVLPGEQRVEFSGLPSGQTFKLTVSNASTYVDVFEGEAAKGQEFVLPKGLLRPGQSYDFLLQATTDGGQTHEVEKESVVVLSEDIASRFAALPVPQSIERGDFAAGVELLSVYLEHDLDYDALKLTQMLLKADGNHPELRRVEDNLKQHLQFAD